MNQKSVIVIDDEHDILELFKIFLAPIKDVRFYFFESYAEALEHIKSFDRVELIICDMHLGEKKGSDLYLEINKLGKLPLTFSYCTADSSVVDSITHDVPVLLKPMSKTELRSFVLKYI